MPQLGETVIYRSKIDNGPGNDVLSPAIVIRTRSTTVASVIDRWGPEPEALTAVDGSTHETASRPDALVAELPDDETVDLVVFGLGKTYREYAVSHGRRKGEWQHPWDVAELDRVEAEILEEDAEPYGLETVFVNSAQTIWAAENPHQNDDRYLRERAADFAVRHGGGPAEASRFLAFLKGDDVSD